MQSGTSWPSAMTERSSGGASHSRHLLIISRYHPGLYEYVRARFADEDNVEVILDRRRGRNRRARRGHPPVDRRETDRRVHAHVDAALRMESMQFVTIPQRTGTAGSRVAIGEATTA
jgi:hypothetical protein